MFRSNSPAVYVSICTDEVRHRCSSQSTEFTFQNDARIKERQKNFCSNGSRCSSYSTCVSVKITRSINWKYSEMACRILMYGCEEELLGNRADVWDIERYGLLNEIE